MAQAPAAVVDYDTYEPGRLLLKSILLGVEKAETLEEAREIVEFLCDKEEITAAKVLAEKKKSRRDNT